MKTNMTRRLFASLLPGLLIMPQMAAAQMIDPAARGLAIQALGRTLSIPVIRVLGHSYTNGAGATNAYYGYGLRAARMLGANKHIYAGYSGAVACHASNGGSGDGGVFFVLNTLQSNISQYGGVSQVSKPESGWGPRHCVLVHEHMLNDLGWLGTNVQPAIEAHRTIWAAFCRSQLFHVGAGASGYVWTSTGTWTASSYGNQQSLAGGCQESSVVGSTKQITLPSNMPSGRVIHFGFTVLPGDSATVTIKQNGNVVKTYTINGAAQCDPATGRTYAGNGVVCRTGNGDGISWAAGDVVTVTVASVTSGAVRYNYMGVEAAVADGPVWAAPLPTRLPAAGYAFYATYFSGGGGQGSSMSDAVIDAGAAALKALCREFPGRAVPVDLSGIVDTSAFPMGSYASDGVHPNNDSHGRRAFMVVQALKNSGLITDRVCAAFDGSLSDIWYPIQGGAAYGASAFLGAAALNGWGQYGTVRDNGSVTLYPGYKIDQNGTLRFRGRVSGGTMNAPICQINQYGTMLARKWYACDAGIDDVWTLSNNATGGTFTLSIAEVGASGSTVTGTTAALAWNASAATIQSAIFSAINGFYDVDVLPVSCSGSLSTGLTITFVQGLGGKPMTVTVNGAGLTGGSATLTHTTTGQTITIPVEVTGAAYLNAGQGNYIIPRSSTAVSWISLDTINYQVDA